MCGLFIQKFPGQRMR